MSAKALKNKPIDIVLDGWVQKKSRQLNRWRRKWIVLSTHCLYTYKNQEIDKNASEIINLSDITSVKINKKQNSFMLIDTNNATYQFQCDHQLQTKQWINAIDAYINCIKIPINIDCKRNVDYCCNFTLPIPYKIEYKYTLNSLIIRIIKQLQRQYPPIQFEATKIISDSFISKEIEYKNYDWDKSDINITDFDSEYITQQGIHLLIDIAIYKHNINTNITCPNMNNNHTCPMYSKMKYQGIFNEKYLQHLTDFVHEKEACKYESCHAHTRLVEGGYDLKDRIHINLYQHCARRKRYQLCQNINCFSLNDEWAENKSLYKPSIQDMIKCVFNEQDGYLNTLIAEIIRNGFKRDLYINEQDMNNNNNNTNYTVMNIVNTLLDCRRHKQMGSPLNRAEMLAVILYTTSDCNYNLCRSQSLSADYMTWKWFDYCLYCAIHKLSQREQGEYKIFTALNDIKLNLQFVECGFFKTYLSTTWKKHIAHSVIDNNEKGGVIFEIDKEFRQHAICCDVSWISKFGNNECEVLIARSIDAEANCFECRVLQTDSENIQSVLLSSFGASERRDKGQDSDRNKKYPLMRTTTTYNNNNNNNKIESNNNFDMDIIDFIDGVTDDIISGYLRRMNDGKKHNMFLIKSIKRIVILYFFNVYERSTYLYPEYVNSKNLNNMLLFEPHRIEKYPNIAFHEETQQLATAVNLTNKHCLFLYDLNITMQKEIKVKSSHVHSSSITACQFCKNGTFLIIYFASTCLLSIWDIRNNEHICIKQVSLEALNGNYPLIQHLMYCKMKWNENGVVLYREDQSFVTLDIKANKTYKTFIFIVCNIKNEKKAKKKSTDVSLSRIGIDEAYNLSRYINKHSPIIKKTKSVMMYSEKQSMEKSIQDALNTLEIDILSQNKNNLPSDLLLQCQELRNILQDANGRIQRFKHEIQSKKFNNSLIAKHVEVNPNSIVSDYYKDIEPQEAKINPFQMPLKTGWVLDQLISNHINNDKSIVCSSNQRRAISTAMISLWDRFNQNKKEKVHLIPYLQELGYPVSDHEKIKQLSVTEYEKKCHKFDIKKLNEFYSKKLKIEKALDLNSFVFGKKSFDQQLRLELFCFWSFFKIKKNIKTIIICGHSNWFNAFLNKYLPKNASFSKAKQVPNCSVVGFRMVCDEIPDGITTYTIVEKSITNIYRGFK